MKMNITTPTTTCTTAPAYIRRTAVSSGCGSACTEPGVGEPGAGVLGPYGFAVSGTGSSSGCSDEGRDGWSVMLPTLWEVAASVQCDAAGEDEYGVQCTAVAGTAASRWRRR
ncbi:hypothetical protein GCM10023217_08050 [Gordonia alkaliphila]|uniref:Uncharacterized protein n=1 Tax=Gordonia alkaliphila TaxID=1053547 RepID=A0ABP8YZS1_9ACTN